MLLALALGACGDVPTDPWADYDLTGRWRGYVIEGSLGFPVVFDLETRGGDVTGRATVDVSSYAVAGRTRYPVVYLRLTLPGDTATFLGESVGPNRLRGTLLFDRLPPVDAEVSLDRR